MVVRGCKHPCVRDCLCYCAGVDKVYDLGTLSDFEKEGLKAMMPELHSSIQKVRDQGSLNCCREGPGRACCTLGLHLGACLMVEPPCAGMQGLEPDSSPSLPETTGH